MNERGGDRNAMPGEAERAVHGALRAAALALEEQAGMRRRQATPGALIFRARHQARRERAVRAVGPIRWARRAALAAAGLLAAALAPALIPAVARLAGTLAPAAPCTATAAAGLAIVGILGAALVVTDLCAPES